jgi:hypothetical protein
MYRYFRVLAVLALIAIPTAAQERDPDKETHGRTYDIRILDSDVAEAIVQKVCDQSGTQFCAVADVSSSEISVEATITAQAKIAAALAKAQVVPSAQVFQVTMIEAENNGDKGLGNVPEPARAALNDARGFLPFNGYQLLGTAVLRTDSNASAIINGPQGADYACELAFRHAITRDGHKLVLRRFQLSRMPPQTEFGQYREGASAVEILNTSFGMRPGETIVVGTSKLEGANRALVVLLTALD